MKKLILLIALLSFAHATKGQAWSGILAPARAVNWSYAGIPGGVPSGAWTQCGSTIAAYGSIGSPASPSTINSAISGCSANTYVLLGSGDFYLNGSINLITGVELRLSSGTVLHATGNNSAYDCNGQNAFVCIVGSNTYTGFCNVGTYWPCPSGQAVSGWQHSANWTAGYSQGATTITLDSVTGIVTNLTPIVLDECDTGYTGSSGVVYCTATDGAITAASVYPSGGGSGYVVNDTGTINAASDFGTFYGSGATYKITSVSGGAVTSFTVTAAGSGYTFTNTNATFANPTQTTKTSGSGTGFEVNITGITPYDNASIFPCAISMVCLNESGANTSRNVRSQSETVIATAITGSGPYTVTLAHPLAHPNWLSGQSPQAWWGSSTITNSGINGQGGKLDLSAVTGSGIQGVTINTAYEVWVEDLASSTANNAHVFAYIASNIEIRDSYFYQTYQDFSSSYGAASFGQVSYAKVENNIFQQIADPQNVAGTCTGCVFGYNFSINSEFNGGGNIDQFPNAGFHAASTDYVLFEGNIGPSALLDAIHGPHFFNTLFRDYYSGREYNGSVLTSRQTIPVVINAFSRYNNVIGSVLGTAGYASNYQCIPASSSTASCTADPTGATDIYQLGWSGAEAQIDFNNTPSLPNDTLTTTSTMRWGNCDPVSSPHCRFVSSEVPTADPNFPNTVPSSNTLPASFYASWTPSSGCGTGSSFRKNPTTGLCPPFPGNGPDVIPGIWQIYICTSGSYVGARVVSAAQCGGTSTADNSLDVPSPAMLCYYNQMSGPPSGTGSMLAFNPGACYEPDPAAITPPAPAPTSFVWNGTISSPISLPYAATVPVTLTGTMSAPYSVPVSVTAGGKTTSITATGNASVSGKLSGNASASGTVKGTSSVSITLTCSQAVPPVCTCIAAGGTCKTVSVVN